MNTILICVAVVVALVLGYRLVLRVLPQAKSEHPLREDFEPRDLLAPDRPFAGLRVWEERFELVQGDAAYFLRVVIPELGVLVDERLRLTHGITRGSDPERARELIGERLWEFLHTTTLRRVPSRSELASVIRELENLWTTIRK